MAGLLCRVACEVRIGSLVHRRTVGGLYESVEVNDIKPPPHLTLPHHPIPVRK